MGSVAFIKEISSSFQHMRTQSEAAHFEPGRGLSPECDYRGTLILNVQVPELQEHIFLLFKSSRWWHLVMALWQPSKLTQVLKANCRGHPWGSSG